MTDWKLWEPPQRKARKPSRPLSAAALAIELRGLIDAAMILDGDIRRNRKALDRLRLLLRRYPTALQRSHITHNIGKRRLEWIARVLE